MRSRLVWTYYVAVNDLKLLIISPPPTSRAGDTTMSTAHGLYSVRDAILGHMYARQALYQLNYISGLIIYYFNYPYVRGNQCHRNLYQELFLYCTSPQNFLGTESRKLKKQYPWWQEERTATWQHTHTTGIISGVPSEEPHEPLTLCKQKPAWSGLGCNVLEEAAKINLEVIHRVPELALVEVSKS